MDAILGRVLARDEGSVETSVIENNLGLSNQELIQFALTARGKNSNHKASNQGFGFKKGESGETEKII